MATLYATSFEAGLVAYYAQNGWTTNLMTIHSGTRVHKTLSGVGGSYAMDLNGISSAGPVLTLNTTSGRWLHFWAAPQTPGTPGPIPVIFQITGSDQFTVLIRADGFIELRRGGVTGTLVATSASAINRGVAHWFAIQLLAADAGGTAEAWVDNALAVSFTGDTKQQTTADWDSIRFGATSNNTDHTIDDLIVTDSTTGKIVEQFCQVLAPTALAFGNFSGTPDDGGVAATGSITTIAGSLLIDGETFTISDGFVSKVFEFDSGGGVGGGNVAVAFTGGDTADQVRDSIISAINGVSSFRVTASSGGSATVSLANDFDGTFGNVAITETVADAGFVVSGMVNGANGSRHQNIDEGGPNGATSQTNYNSAAAVNDEEMYAMSDPATPTTVHCMVVWAEAARSGSITQAQISVKSGSTTVYATAEVLPASGYESVFYIRDTDPNTAAAWTGSGLNAVQTGLKFS